MTRLVNTRLELLRNNSKVCDLKTVIPAKIIMRNSSEIKTSLSASVLADARANWLTDEIRAVLTIDGIDYNYGVYAVATATETTTATEITENIEAYDRGWFCKSTLWLAADIIRGGVNYVAAIETLLNRCNITMIMKTPTSNTIDGDRTWDNGTSYLRIINELLAEINYKPLWFNSDGYAVLEPQRIPTAENIEHTLNAADIKSLLLPDTTKKTDIFSAANVFVAQCSNPEKTEALVAMAINDNPASPLSTVKRGRRIYHFEKLNNIASQEELDKYVDNLRWRSMAIGETVTAITALLPGYGVSDVVALSTKNISGLFLSSGWVMDFTTGGNMQHTLERVVFTY